MPAPLPERSNAAGAPGASVAQTRRLQFLRTVTFLVSFLAFFLSVADPLEWHAENWGRWAALAVPAQGKTVFTLLAPEQTGIDFTNVLLEFSSATNRILQNGAGVALGDYDQDGWLDVFVCGLDSPSAL